MEALNLITKTREYLNYLEEHILNIQKAWIELQDKCKDMRFIFDDYVFHQIDEEVQSHDLSKFSEQEFVQYRKSFYPLKNEPKFDMSKAWEHHKKHNPHHWENWVKNLSYPSKTYINPYYWEVHCVHMIIDWMAMGYHFKDTAQSYYETHKEEIKIPKYLIGFIYEIFIRIRV